MVFDIFPTFERVPWKCLPECFAVSQISRLWRRVALGLKSLWSSIPLQCVACTELALEHSKPAPISLYIWPYASEDGSSHEVANALFDKTVPLALREWPRVRIFSADLAPDGCNTLVYTEAIIHQLKTCAAPELEVLCLMSGGDYGLGIFGGVTPTKLRFLTLEDFDISPNSPLLLALLTSLKLREVNFDWPSMDAFIETLTALPCLQILSLEMYEGSSIQDPAHSSVYGYHTIRLSCLEQLTIADGPQQVTAMMKFLYLPHTVVLNLTCLGYYNESGVVSYSTFKTDIRDALSHHFAAANATGNSYTDVCFDMHGMNTAGFEIRLSRPCRSSSTEAVAIDGSLSSAAPISLPPFMKLTYLGPVDPYDQQAMSFVSDFIAALPIFSGARTLRVRHTTALRLAIDWERIAGCMPQLKAVSVQRNSAHGLISGMTIEGASSPIFPMLKVIGVEMVDFSEITYGETSFCDGLLAGLSNIGREAPPYLFIQNCMVSEEMIKELWTKLGEKVRWDGVEDAVWMW